MVRTASAAIAQMHRINLFPDTPTLSSIASLVRNAAARDIGVAPVNVKLPFEWNDIATLASRFCTSAATDTEFCTSLMAAASFVAAARFSDLQPLQWTHLDDSQPGVLVIRFTTRKNDQFRKGSTASLQDDPSAAVNIPDLFRVWRSIRRPQPSDYIFTFTRRASSPVSYDAYYDSLATLMGPVVGLSPADFKKSYGTKSGRAGGATAAFQAGVPLPLIRRQGGWRSNAVHRYIAPSQEQDTSFAKAVTKPR